MKTKLIQIKDYLFLIDEEVEINYGDYWIYISSDGNIFEDVVKSSMDEISWFSKLHDRKNYKKIIAYHPLSQEAKELDLPILPKLFEVKQFSLEDMEKAIEMSRLQGKETFLVKYTAEEIIQSLYTQKLPKEFIPEYKNRCCGRCDGWNDTCVSDEICPEHKVEGCEICYGERGNKIKTIINTEGKEELVGVYKYYP